MIYVLLPVYNEEDVIEALLDRVQKVLEEASFEYKIVAVNDGSSDKTAEVIRSCASRMPVHLIDFERNRGVGDVFREGFKYVLDTANDKDIMVSMDADNTHDPRLIKFMVNRLDEGYEVVIASCFAPGGMLIGVPALRYVCTVACNLLYRILFPVRGIKEYTGFYRGYNVGALRQSVKRFDGRLLESNGFAVMAECLVKLRRMPLFMTEVPLILRYDHKGEKSKLKVIPTIKEHFRVIWDNVFKRHIL
ncbi:MAG: glycosyltransferase family 2 protein [Candidatus Omnitrophica bacterium]|nr:glycosyltransferase family 2 protein [Candidatus Omnitrophota bacterium]